MALSFLASFELDRTEFPDDLHQSRPVRRTLPRAGWLIAMLLLVTLVPRAWMACKVETLTEDGPIYIYAAIQLARGDFEAAFRHGNLGLNLYPLVLLKLHELGLPWETAGAGWGTLMATLVVLPMFGWVRRQFSDRVAAVACLLYAAHPGLIERSPELLRCPTFWFLLMAAVHFLWRGVTEVRTRLFLCAGVCFTLGVHFRIETWFLLVPWLIWTIARCRALTIGRRRLLAGAAAGLLVLPAFGLLLNVTWLRDHSQWEWCLTQRASVFKQLLAPLIQQEPAMAPGAPSAPVPSPPSSARPGAAPVDFVSVGQPSRAPRSAGRLVKVYVDKLVDAVDPLFGLLLLPGLWTWRRTLLRIDKLAMVAFCLVCLAGVAAFWLLVHDIQGRYFFPVVLVSANYAALGVFSISGVLVRLVQRIWSGGAPRLGLANLAVLATVIVIGWADALTNDYNDRAARRELGEWIHDSIGPGQSILGSEPRAWTLAYYAQARYYGPALEEFGTPEYLRQTRAVQPTVVLVTARRGDVKDSPWYRQLQADKELVSQFRTLPEDCLPPSARGMLVLVHAPVWAQVVQRVPLASSRTSSDCL